jgi:hypothetical protein
MTDKKLTLGLLWNVNERRVESVHESLKAAKDAEEKFTEKSGANQALTRLATAEFTVPAPRTDR